MNNQIKLMDKIARVLLFSVLTLTATFSSLPLTNAVAETKAADAPLDWRVTGPFGGDVRSLVVDPNDEQHIYFGTLDGQIYTSTDGAHMWTRLQGFNHPGLSIESLIVDPRESKMIYAAGYVHKRRAVSLSQLTAVRRGVKFPI